jgi:hypothetical protein
MLDSQPAWWGFRPPPGRRHSILELIVEGTLDAEFAAILWLLVERTVPVLVVAGPPMAGKTTLLTAVLDLVPASTELQLVTGLTVEREAFDRAPTVGAAAAVPAPLPETPASGPVFLADPRPSARYLLVPELSNHLPVYVWGSGARRLVRAASTGVGLAATMHGDRLEDVFDQLSAAPVSLNDDELSHLGIVLVLGVVRQPTGWQRRIRAAHYVRPVARDAGGHVQRRPPAVLVAWDPGDDTFSHFEWGIAEELAARVGLRGADFENERVRRAAWMRAAIERGHLDVAGARAAFASYRPEAPAPMPDPS